jgi:hypothetical protein
MKTSKTSLHKLFASALVLTSLFGLSLSVSARGRGALQFVPVGHGISSPSVNTALSGAENPASFPHLGSAQIVVTAAQPEDASQTKTGGTFNWGNGGFGLGLGAAVITSEGSTASTQETLWGLGGYINGINTSIGISGGSNSSTTVSTNIIGFLINPMGGHRFGVTSYGESHYGLGYSYIGNSVILSIDAQTISTAGSSATNLAPGILFDADNFQFSLTQKMVSSGSTTSSTTMAALGFGTASFAMSLYYNYLATYGLGLTFGF